MDTANSKSRENQRDVLHEYQEQFFTESELLNSLARRWKAVAFLRGGMLLISLLPLLLAARTVLGVNQPWLILSGVLFLAFIAIAIIHERMSQRIRVSRILVRMHQESIARIERNLDQVRAPLFEIADEIVPVSTDLDLFGTHSLYTLLATPRTPNGCKVLGDWISHPASQDEIKARQVAVDELRPRQRWRQSFRLRCEQLSASQSGPSQFVAWASDPCWIDSHRPLLWFCRLTAAVSILAIAAIITGLLPLTIAGPTLIVTFVINFFIGVFFAGSIHEIFNQISSHRHEFRHYENLFSEVIKFDSRSPFLQTIRDELNGGKTDVRSQILALSFWNSLANFRRNGVFFLLYLLFQFLFVWDIHILDRMEHWKRQHGRNIETWFSALARWEAILALSKLAYDNPTWTFAEMIDRPKSESLIRCEDLGHPLMDHQRVTNDVSVGPAGTVLLVSGSNMSGKSTLLRSIGLNCVLAQMGSVVCASSMSLPSCRIETSMRIVDSLATGTSFFMAELKRLKEIVDRAESLSKNQETSLLFLLDEILQGTNSRERQIAVSKVVQSLIVRSAIGAISTHDLELATTPELADACVPVHFSEKFEEIDGKQTMTFDYKMKTGIAETTNALKLLEIVGLYNDN